MLDGSLGQQFEFIVVGAGPAGCVLASRLSERPASGVLLIEAGPDAAIPGSEHPDLLDPYCLIASENTAFQWPKLIVEAGANLGDGLPRAVRPYVQGFGVGGASNMNGMGVDRGLPEDYDEWQSLGAQGWGWSEVLPYFRRLERDLDFSSTGVSTMHGDSGPMPVRRPPRSDWAPFSATVAEVLQHRGFEFIEDYTADFREGFSSAPTNCVQDRRVSASMAYLTAEVRRRPNLQILANTRVERVNFSGKSVHSVVVRQGDIRKTISSRQVILACGAIQTPTLLMRSGVGRGEDLRALGIPVVQDLAAVGANLQNHPHVGLTTYLAREAAQADHNKTFLQNWLRYSSHHPGCAPKDMHLMALNKCAWHGLGARVGYLVTSVLKAYSKGRVALATADPLAEPQVQFNLLKDLRDEDRLVDGLRFVLGIMADPAVARLRSQLFLPNTSLVASLNRRTVWNGLKARAIATILDRPMLRQILLEKSRIDPEELLADEQALRQFVKKNVRVQFHVCGTCRMGRSDDAAVVVDHEGRVHGVQGLRVADASIFPTIPRGYTHFIVLMAAEKIADAVKDASKQRET